MAHLFCLAVAAAALLPPRGSSCAVFPELESPDDVAVLTSGKLCRKLAINSSPGF